MGKKQNFDSENVEKPKWNPFLQTVITFGGIYDDLIKSYELMENPEDEDTGRAVFRGAVTGIITMLSPYIGLDKVKDLDDMMREHWKKGNCESFITPIIRKEILPLALKYGFLPPRSKEPTTKDKLKDLKL